MVRLVQLLLADVDRCRVALGQWKRGVTTDLKTTACLPGAEVPLQRLAPGWHTDTWFYLMAGGGPAGPTVSSD